MYSKPISQRKMSQEKFKKIQTNENKNTAYQNSYVWVKAIPREIYIMNAYLEKEERSQIKNLVLHFEKL